MTIRTTSSGIIVATKGVEKDTTQITLSSHVQMWNIWSLSRHKLELIIWRWKNGQKGITYNAHLIPALSQQSHSHVSRLSRSKTAASFTLKYPDSFISSQSTISMVFAAEDLEAGTRKPKFQTEPTLPIYLKVTNSAIFAGFLSWMFSV